jgi:hypothetical protein
MRFTRRVLLEIEAQAKIITLQGEYASGALAESITIDGPRLEGTKIRGSVGTRKDYARAVHDGAKVHWIFPKGATGFIRFGSRRKPQLKFFWRREGRVVFMPHVPGSRNKIGHSHPGIRYGKRFLAIPLEAAGRRHNMRVTIDDL